MIKLIILVLILILLPSSALAHNSFVTVNMTRDGFDPGAVTLDINSSVVFLNVDLKDHWPASNIHPTHEIYSEFDPKRGISPGQSWTFKPQRIGSFKFHDHLFPQNQGVVEVVGENGVLDSTSNKDNQQSTSKIFDIQKEVDQVISSGQFSLKGDENENNYLRFLMDACFKNGGRDNCYKNISFLLFYQFDLPKLLQLLSDNEKYPEVFSRCHELTHYLTRLSYQREQSISKVYDACTSVCHGGCYHGAIEEYLSEKNLSIDLSSNYKPIKKEILKVCGKKEDYKVPLLYDECLHGIGHGTMYITDSDLPTALKLCDLLGDEQKQQTCYGGAFMENSSSSTNLDHPSKFIKKDDPLYPCDILDKKYLGVCYRYQSSHFAILTQSNWAQVAKMCMRVPKDYRPACFLTIGSNLVGFTQEIKTIINNCSLIEEENYQTYCYLGAVDALAIRYRNEPEKGFNFCSQVPLKYQKSCFNQYGISISSWSNDQSNLSKLCKRLENPQYALWCKGGNEYFIKMTKNGFEPAYFSIDQNSIVEFKNEDNLDHWPASDVHPTHQIYPEFDPKKRISPKKSWKFQFKKSGTFKFHDHLFPHIKGSILVKINQNGPSLQKEASIVTRVKQLFSDLITYFKKLFVVDKKITKADFLKLNANKKQQQLKELTKKDGVEKTWVFLKEVFKDQVGSEGEIHDLAHLLGSLIFDDKGLSGLKLCDSAFAFGCFHGFLDKAFSDSLDKLNEAQKSCEQIGQGISGPVASCIHGIGHGVASFYRTADINNSLKSCDGLTQGAQYCYDGVFMEFARNSQASLYKQDNPLYPCDSIDQKYVFSCGRNQVRVMMDRLKLTFAEIAKICVDSSNADFKKACFNALGFDAVVHFSANDQLILSSCSKIIDDGGKAECIKAASGELIFQNISGWQQASVKLCQGLSPDTQKDCFTYIEQIKKDYGRN